MKPRPAIYDAILIIGSKTPKNEDSTVAKIGGRWAQPNLGLSYLLAAWQVIQTGQDEGRINEVALPAAYLQRHAFEIALKDTTDMAFAIKRDMVWLDRLERDPSAVPPKRDSPKFEHDFRILLHDLELALEFVGHGKVPADITSMANRLGTAEDFSAERFRYLTKWGGDLSFKETTFLPIGETQDLLEDLFHRFFAYQGEDAVDGNLVTLLAHSEMALDEAVRQIVPLSSLVARDTADEDAL